MIEKKIVTSNKKEYESIYVVQPFQECCDCGHRVHSNYLVRFRITHNYEVSLLDNNTRIRIPLDSSNVASLSFYKMDLLDFRLNTIKGETKCTPLMVPMTNAHENSIQHQWQGRNSTNVDIYEGLGVDVMYYCDNCYDEDYEDEDGNNDVGTDVSGASMYLTLNGHLHNTTDTDKIRKVFGHVFSDLKRKISIEDDSMSISVGDLHIEIDVINTDTNSLANTAIAERSPDLAKDHSGGFFEVLRVYPDRFNRFCTPITGTV